MTYARKPMPFAHRVKRMKPGMVLAKMRGKPDDNAHRTALIRAQDFRRAEAVPELTDFRGKR